MRGRTELEFTPVGVRGRIAAELASTEIARFWAPHEELTDRNRGLDVPVDLPCRKSIAITLWSLGAACLLAFDVATLVSH
jgi:hypothetical protein